MTNLTGKTIRLYETCATCDGSGHSGKYPEVTCPTCHGKGTVTTHVKFEDMAEALQAIAQGAAEYVAQQKAKPAKVKCGHCDGRGEIPRGRSATISCLSCNGTGEVTA